MITRQSILLVAIVALLSGPVAFGDVYLSTGGNDGNDGLSVGTPKLTLGAAITVFNTQAAPTTLHIAAGAYTQTGVFTVTPVGTAANAVTIQGEGGTVTLNQSVLQIQGAYTTVKDLVIHEQQAHEACVLVRSTAANCTIQNCSMTGVKEQAAEHFNPNTSEGNEPEDVAPVQVLGAPNCTITGCTIINVAPNLMFWDDAILMPDANGTAGNLTISNCLIDGASNCGGIRLLRASNNTQVLNTNVFRTRYHSFEISSGTSLAASGNSDQILIQDCNFDGCSGFLSPDAQIRIYDCLASHVTLRRVTMAWDPTNGADGFSICGATVANVLLDQVTQNHLYAAVSDYMVTFRASDGPNYFNAYVTNFEMKDSNVVGGNFLQLFLASVTNYTFRNVHCIARSNWINTNFGGNAVNPAGNEIHVKNWVMEDCTYKDNVRTGGYGFTLGGLIVDIDGFTMTRCDFRQNFGYHNLCIFPTGGSAVKNFNLTDTTIQANSCAFFILGSTAEHINLTRCNISGGAACVLFQEQSGYPPKVFDLSIVDCVLKNATSSNDFTGVGAGAGTPPVVLGLDWPDFFGYNACISFRNAGELIVGATINNVVMSGRKGFFINGNNLAGDEKRDFTVNNLVANVTHEGILSTGASVQRNWTFNNCQFHSADYNAVDIEGGSLWDNTNFQNCSFTGGEGFQAAGFFLEQTSTINNATWANCQFTCASTVNDSTEKRTAAFLMEDENSLISNAGFTNCSFDGGNVALAWQRWQIQNGAGLEPVVTNVLVKDCTMVSATDRAISLQYLEGSNAVFQNVAIQGNPAIGLYAEVNGNAFKFVNMSYDGGGTAKGAFIATTLNFESANWLMRGCSLTNLAGIGLQIRAALKTSTFENNTLTGAAGSTHGIYVDNSLASAPGAKQAVSLTFKNNNISGFGGDGMRVNGSSHIIQNCTVANAGGDGINLRDDSALRPVNATVNCSSNVITDCAGVGLVVEGQGHTVGFNSVLRDGEGIRVRNGVLRSPGQASNKNNNISRNRVYGHSIPSGTGLWEALNPSITADPGPNTNTYLNNTVTDWAQGSEFRGANNRVQNNIFFFNTGTGLRILPSGLSGLKAGWNCSPRVVGNQFDGIFIDYSKDIWYNPGFASRTPGDPDFYKLGPLSGCLDRGTTDGLVADGDTDLGAIESGDSEVATWRLY